MLAAIAADYFRLPPPLLRHFRHYAAAIADAAAAFADAAAYAPYADFRCCHLLMPFCHFVIFADAADASDLPFSMPCYALR